MIRIMGNLHGDTNFRVWVNLDVFLPFGCSICTHAMDKNISNVLLTCYVMLTNNG